MTQLVHWRMTRSPEFYVRNVGTCGLTMLEDWDGGEYFFPIAPTSVVLAVGGLRREPVVRNDTVAVGKVLRCVLMADNFVIPGMVGAKVAKDFTDLLQSGDFISEELRRRTGADRVS